MMKKALLMAVILAAAAQAPAAFVHTTDADFRAGSGDGNVDIGAGDGDGSVRLAKLAGTLGAWEAAGSLPYAVRSGSGWMRNGRAWWAGGVTSGLTSTVATIGFDGSGMVGTSASHSSLPLSSVNGGAAQWGRWLYLGLGSPIAGVYRAELDLDGAPSNWTLVAAPPSGMSSDANIRLGADYGRVYWVPGTFNASTFSAPILPDGSLGAWQSEDARNASNSYFGLAWAMGRFFVLGGENGSWVGQTHVDTLTFNASGVAGLWSAGTALPAGRSYIDTGQMAYAGKVFVAGGKSYSGTNTYFSTVYASTLGSGGSMGAWSTDTPLSANSSQHMLYANGGYLYLAGGSEDGPTPKSAVLRAALNQGSANAAQGVYVNAFDNGSDQALSGLAFVAVPAGQVSVQVRTALDGQDFGGWTAASTASPLSLTWSARYVEYRMLFNDGGGGDVRLEQVQLATPAPTPTPTAVVGDEIDKYKGGPFKGEEGEAIAFPNPAVGGQTKFGFTLQEAGVCTLTVWTSGGTLASQISDSFGPGKGMLKLNIKDYAPGVYLFQLVIDYSGGRKVNGPIKKFAVNP